MGDRVRIREVALGFLVLLVLGQSSASAAFESLLGVFERVCLATGADYEAVVSTMVGPGWVTDIPERPGYDLVAKKIGWMPDYLVADESARPTEAEVQKIFESPGEGLLLGITANLSADPAKFGIVSTCSVAGVVEPKSLDAAVERWGYHPTDDPDIWALDQDPSTTQVRASRGQGFGTILHLFRMAE